MIIDQEFKKALEEMEIKDRRRHLLKQRKEEEFKKYREKISKPVLSQETIVNHVRGIVDNITKSLLAWKEVKRRGGGVKRHGYWFKGIIYNY